MIEVMQNVANHAATTIIEKNIPYNVLPGNLLDRLLPKKVVSVTTGKNLPFTYKDEMVNFSVRSLKIFEMYEIEF